MSKNKIKKNINDSKVIQLEENSDILSYLGKNNKNRPKVVVGFSAETENVIKNSKVKLKEKYCDLIVANDVSKKDQIWCAASPKMASARRRSSFRWVCRTTSSRRSPPARRRCASARRSSGGGAEIPE